MNTPICDFVRRYAESNALRLHMPGHKGTSFLGFEAYDITEIDGADSLYEANGIIAESERNASKLFCCDTYYSTEGSSKCIRAMLYLAALYAKKKGKRPHVAALRNVHKSFLSAAALIGFETTWIYPKRMDSYLSCKLTSDEIECFVNKYSEKITAVYITSPDYLGNITDLQKIADICHKHDVLLLVDNAHGAYLKFLPESLHPMDFGADLCCDSAHKTLPVLTGGAYLHISDRIAESLAENVKNALAMFGSTSPSYLILQSLDAANRYLYEGYRKRLAEFCIKAEKCKNILASHGYVFCGDEPLKLTICTKKYGYYGYELLKILSDKGIICEFGDPDFLVIMLTPETDEKGLERMTDALLSIPKKNVIEENPPVFSKPTAVMPIREAAMCPCKIIPTKDCLGKILAAANVGCPPAVPILVCGERIDENAIKCFEYYGICNLTVIR